MEIFSPTISLLEQSVAYEAQRASIIAHNIANIDTPDYQRISFAKTLADTRKKLGLPAIDDADYGLGEVDLDKEMSALGEVKTVQTSYLRLLSLQLGILKKVVTQGKG